MHEVGMEKEKSSAALIAVKAFLWLLFPFAAIWGLISVMGGLVMGFRLFRLENLWPTVLWISIIALPVIIFHNLRTAGDDLLRLSLIALGVIAFVVFYVAVEVI